MVARLSKAAQVEYDKLFDQLHAVGVLLDPHLGMAYANAIIQAREAQKELDKPNGMTVTLGNGKTQPSPWIEIRDRAFDILDKLGPRLRVNEALEFAPYRPPRGKGRPKKVGDKELINALWATGGLPRYAARLLNIDPVETAERVKATPSMQAVLDMIKAGTLELAKFKHMEAMRRGEPWAIAFYLKCFGKEEGWIERPPQPRGGDNFGDGEVIEGEFRVTVKGGLPVGPPPPQYHQEMPAELREDDPPP